MRKKFLAAAMCVCLGMSLFGCSKSSDSENDTTAADTSSSEDDGTVELAYTEDELVDDTAGDLNILDYVELTAYTGLELTKDVTEVTDEDVESQMSDDALELVTEDAEVKDGDIAVIDFVGKLDGEAFSGGTGSDYELEIGSDSFIDGFEDGLIGVKKGETVDLNLTFPESYGNDDLAGKDVVFTVTVNSIKRKPAELTDEWFAANTKYASVEEYRTEVRQELEAAADEDAVYTMESDALDTIVSNSTIKKYYKSLIEEGGNQYESYMETYASYYGMELSDFIEAQGMTDAEYQSTKSQQAVSYAQVAMVVNAIAQEAALSSEDEGYQNILSDLAAAYYMSADELEETYGESVVNMSVMSEYVMNYIADNANVTTNIISEETEE